MKWGCDGRPRPKLTSIPSFLSLSSPTVCVRMRTWVSLPLPPLPPPSLALPSPFAAAAAAFLPVSSVVAVEERDGGGGEWRFGSPSRAVAAIADAAAAARSIIPTAVAFRVGAQFLSRNLAMHSIQFWLKEKATEGNV